MARRRIDRVELKKTESHGYEFQVGPFDYHVRFEDGAWMLDQFEAAIQDPDGAHVRTVECESLNDAVHFALEEILA